MRILDVLESLEEEARSLPEETPLEAVVRVRFVRRRGRVLAELRVSDGRRAVRNRGAGVTSGEALRDAVA